MKQSKSGLRILYVVTQFADEDSNSTGYLWWLLIQSAKTSGVAVHLITPRTDFPRWMPKVLVKIVATAALITECLWRLPRHSTVLCATNPAFLPLAISMVQRIKRAKVYVLIHDLFPLNTVQAGLMAEKGLAFRVLLALFTAAYRRCAGVIVIGRDMQQVVAVQLGARVPVLYVPNWVPAPTSEIARVKPLGSLCRFQYFGNLGVLQGLDFVLEGVAKSKAKNARFEFIGAGAAQAAVAAHPILSLDDRVTLRAGVAFRDRNSILADCDVSLVTLRPQMYGLAVPSKAYFSLAHGIPFLYMGDPDSELHLTLCDHPSLGWFVPAGKAQDLADQIDRICLTPPDSFLSVEASGLLLAIHPDQARRKIMRFIGM